MKLTTATGREIDPGNPEYEFSDHRIGKESLLTEIVVGLSQVHRFSGQLGPLTVAQHSVGVSSFFSVETKLMAARLALVHDASEAYLGDVPTPLKQLLPDYRALELRYEQALWVRLLGTWPGDEIARVREADHWAFKNEVYVLSPSRKSYGTNGDYVSGYAPFHLWDKHLAREKFYGRAIELGLPA